MTALSSPIRLVVLSLSLSPCFAFSTCMRDPRTPSLFCISLSRDSQYRRQARGRTREFACFEISRDNRGKSVVRSYYTFSRETVTLQHHTCLLLCHRSKINAYASTFNDQFDSPCLFYRHNTGMARSHAHFGVTVTIVVT